MITIDSNGILIKNGKTITKSEVQFAKEDAQKNTLVYKILENHNVSNDEHLLKIRFDAMATYDITYVGIIQTALESGMTYCPIPYVLTNCHSCLCAAGGTICKDDQEYGYSAAKKFDGICVPAHHAVIHQYMCEEMTKCGNMILGSGSHTRYGAGDVSSHQSLSIRHTTRNFSNREGSKPSSGQIASVTLMDALSIAATASNTGILTSAMELVKPQETIVRDYGVEVNEFKVHDGFANPQKHEKLVIGPNITQWPEMIQLTDHLLLQMTSVIHDESTTRDDFIPSGENSSLRSNPLKLGGVGNIALQYATKRYRSNLVTLGMIHFVVDDFDAFENGDLILIKDIRQAISSCSNFVKATLIRGEVIRKIELKLEGLTKEESEIILEGCLINYYNRDNGVKK